MSIDARHPMLTEDQEQALVCGWLDVHGVVYFAVPNGAHVAKRHAAKLKRTGLKKGVADLIIVTPDKNGRSGALEMKREDGGDGGSAEQREWLARFRASGWWAYIAHGSLAAIKELKRRGYGKRGSRCRRK